MMIEEWRYHMMWNKPKIVDIALGAEINSYVCGKTK